MKRTFKEFQDQWEQAGNSVGGGGVSMPADAVHDKKKKKKDIYDGRTKAGRKFVERIISRRKAAEAKKEVKENVNSDVKKVMPSLEKALKKERIKSLRDIERFFDYDGGDIIFDKIKNQDKANMAIHHAKELLIKKYKLKEETIEEAKKIQDIARKHKRELQKIQKSGNLELSKKAEAELYQWASNNGEIRGDEEDEFWNWIDNNVDDLVKGRIKEDVSKYDFRYWRGTELELKNRALGRDVEAAFKKAGYNDRDVNVSGTTVKFNTYSKHWGTDQKKLKAAIKKVLGIDVDRL